MSNRTPLVAGNWKMNLTIADAVALVSDLKPLVAASEKVEIVVCPTATALKSVADAAAGSNIAVGGQNCYSKASGAFTGELSPQMLADAGCAWAIIGHSERRQIFGETDDMLNAKTHFAVASGMKVMFCIGETLEEREGGSMNAVLERQITEGLKGLSADQFKQIAIAYEPVWAIGTGVTASPAQAEEAHKFVRGVVANTFGAEVADGVRIQYGGSVKPDNAAELMANANVDGALVGGAALDAASFAAIVKATCPGA